MVTRTLFLTSYILTFIGIILFCTQNTLQFLWMGLSLTSFSILGYLIYRTTPLIQYINQISVNSNSWGYKVKLVIENYSKGTDYKSNIQFILDNIDKLGLDEFETEIMNVSDKEVKDALIGSSKRIKELRRREEKSAWINEGITRIAEIKANEQNLDLYCQSVINEIIKYLNVNQGAFFLTKIDGETRFFDLVASYAYGRRKHQSLRIDEGQGTLGQIFYEKDLIYFTEVPKDYIRITSGLGEALPRCVCMVPFVSDGIVHGAIEIASFKELHDFEFEYLKKISENVAYNLATLENQQRREYMLSESMRLTQEMRAQEEELRQSMVELQSTQEQMVVKQMEMDTVLSSLSTVELDLDGQISQANQVFLSITGYSSDRIIGKDYKELIPQHGNDPIQYEIMWNSLLEGRSFSGEFRIVNGDNKEIWMAGNFTPILDKDGNPYKVMVISLFTTQDKEKLFELQEYVTALKSCLPIAEIYDDLSFKTANDLFLNELEIRRIDLRTTLLSNILSNGALGAVEKHLKIGGRENKHITLTINTASGEEKKYLSSVLNMNSGSDKKKRSILVLQPVE